MKKIKKGIAWQIRKLINYFLKGLLISLPAIITFEIIKWLVVGLDTFFNLETPGLGILIVLCGLILIGFIGSSIIFQPLLDVLDDVLSQTPFVKIIYTSVKDLIEAFVGEKKKFNKPVMVEITQGIFKPGFVTQDNCNEFEMNNYVAVYFPHSYAFSGNVFLVERNKIKFYNGNQADFMKYIISGAVTKMGSGSHENNN